MVYFPGEGVLDWIVAADVHIRERLGKILQDTIPSYRSLLVIYHADKIGHTQMLAELRQCLEGVPQGESVLGKLVKLPVYYSAEVGIDLQRIADHTGLDVEQIVELHQGREYRVHALGFAPGFAYLGKLESGLHTPRLESPRKTLAAGSVAIADDQTAVYPSVSPGGWNLLGNCPLPMLTAERMPLLRVGDRVRFYSIGRAEFWRMQKQYA